MAVLKQPQPLTRQSCRPRLRVSFDGSRPHTNDVTTQTHRFLAFIALRRIHVFTGSEGMPTSRIRGSTCAACAEVDAFGLQFGCFVNRGEGRRHSAGSSAALDHSRRGPREWLLLTMLSGYLKTRWILRSQPVRRPYFGRTRVKQAANLPAAPYLI